MIKPNNNCTIFKIALQNCILSQKTASSKLTKSLAEPNQVTKLIDHNHDNSSWGLTLFPSISPSIHMRKDFQTIVMPAKVLQKKHASPLAMLSSSYRRRYCLNGSSLVVVTFCSTHCVSNDNTHQRVWILSGSLSSCLDGYHFGCHSRECISLDHALAHVETFSSIRFHCTFQ